MIVRGGAGSHRCGMAFPSSVGAADRAAFPLISPTASEIGHW